jgi:hypothetical protein
MQKEWQVRVKTVNDMQMRIKVRMTICQNRVISLLHLQFQI